MPPLNLPQTFPFTQDDFFGLGVCENLVFHKKGEAVSIGLVFSSLSLKKDIGVVVEFCEFYTHKKKGVGDGLG